MAIVDSVGPIRFPDGPTYGAGTPAFTSTGTINDANDKVAFIIQVPKTGTLDWFECRQLANTDAPDNGLRFSFQNIGAASGDPDGTQDQYRDVVAGFGANTWLVPPGVMTDDGTNGGVKRSVTAGDWIACVVEYVTFVAGDSVTFSQNSVGTGQSNAWSTSQYLAQFETAWNKDFRCAPLALKYSDSTYGVLPLAWAPILTYNATTFNNVSASPSRGIRFQLPFAARVGGAWLRALINADCTFNLYSNADTLLASVTIDGNANAGGTSMSDNMYWFTAAVDLTANTTYRLVLTATSGSNLMIGDADLNAAALMACLPGGAQIYTTHGTTGAWSDVTTNRTLMGLVLTGLDDGSGGGGGSHPFFG